MRGQRLLRSMRTVLLQRAVRVEPVILWHARNMETLSFSQPGFNAFSKPLQPRVGFPGPWVEDRSQFSKRVKTKVIWKYGLTY